MSSSSDIEWTDATWNPVRGCTKISPGCKHCYAETFAERWRGIAGHPYEQGFGLRLVPEKLTEPLTWGSPKMIFVNSMSDLFQAPVPDEFIVAVAGVMALAPWHTFQVLTKRSARMRDMLNGPLAFAATLPNIWWGVSVEDRKYGLPRIRDLREAKARVRFLSVEPLLESLGTFSLRGIHWVIVGGESGPGARPMESTWATAIRDDCARASVPFFFKQWGGVRKGEHGRRLDRRLHNGFPEVVRAEAPALAERRVLEQRAEQLRAKLTGLVPRGMIGGSRGTAAFDSLGA
jgi:protein gp37